MNDNDPIDRLIYEVRELRIAQEATVAVVDVLAQIMEARGLATRAEIAEIIGDSADFRSNIGVNPMQADVLAMMRLIAKKIAPAPAPQKPPLVLV